MTAILQTDVYFWGNCRKPDETNVGFEATTIFAKWDVGHGQSGKLKTKNLDEEMTWEKESINQLIKSNKTSFSVFPSCLILKNTKLRVRNRVLNMIILSKKSCNSSSWGLNSIYYAWWLRYLFINFLNGECKFDLVFWNDITN